MSCPHIVWALRESRARKLPAMDRLVLMVVAEWANGDLVCWPSIGQLASDTGLAERTVQFALARLEGHGLLTIERRARRTSVYRVLRRRIGEGLSEGPRQTKANGESHAPLAREGESGAPLSPPGYQEKPAGMPSKGESHAPINGESHAPQIWAKGESDDAPRVNQRAVNPLNEPLRRGDSSNEESLGQPKTRRRPPRRMLAGIPHDWQPGEAGIAYAEARGVPPDPEVGKFLDYHIAHGSGSCDWAASWRTWCNNYDRFGRPRIAMSGGAIDRRLDEERRKQEFEAEIRNAAASRRQREGALL